MIIAAAEQAALLNLYRRYITLPFQCIPGPKVTTRNELNKREPEWLYDRAKLRKEHFKPEDSVKEKDDLREEVMELRRAAAKSKGQDERKDSKSPSGPKNDPKSPKIKMLGHVCSKSCKP